MSDERKMSSLEGWVRAASRKMKNVKKKEKSKEGCKNNWRVWNYYSCFLGERTGKVMQEPWYWERSSAQNSQEKKKVSTGGGITWRNDWVDKGALRRQSAVGDGAEWLRKKTRGEDRKRMPSVCDVLSWDYNGTSILTCCLLNTNGFLVSLCICPCSRHPSKYDFITDFLWGELCLG